MRLVEKLKKKKGERERLKWKIDHRRKAWRKFIRNFLFVFFFYHSLEVL